MIVRHLLLCTLCLLTLAAQAYAQVPVTGPVPVQQPLPVPGVGDVPSPLHPADVTVTLYTESDTLAISGLRLHGVDWYDRKTGTGGDPQGLDLTARIIRPIRSLVTQYPRATWSAEVRPSDAPTVCELAPDAYGDSAPALNWCLIERAAQRRPGTVDTLHIPAGVYGFAGPIEIPDSLHIQGAGGAVVTTRTDRYGHTYRPTVPTESGTAFRQLPETQFTFLGLAMGEPLREDERVRIALRQDRTAWMLAPGAALLSIADIQIDGGGESDLPRLLRAKASDDPAVQKALMDGLQNSPSHTGLAVTIHGGLDVREAHDPRPDVRGDTPPGPRTWTTPDDGYPEGQGWRTLRARHTLLIPGTVARVRNVSITGFAATGILGDYRAHWDIRDSHFGDCLWNHSVYKADGRWENVTFSGYSWHHAVMQGTDLGTIEGLVIHEQAPNPSGRDTGAALDIRLDNGEDAFLRGLYADLTNLPGGRLADVAPRWYDPAVYEGTAFQKPDDVALHLRDATVLTDGSRLLSFRREGPVTLDTLTIHTPDPERFTLAYPADKLEHLTTSAVTVTDTTAAPIVVPPPTDCTDELDALQAENAALRRQLDAVTRERDAALRQFREAQARSAAAVRILTGQ